MYMPPPAPMKSIIKNLVPAKFLIFKGLSLPHLKFPLSIAVLVHLRKLPEGMGVTGRYT